MRIAVLSDIHDNVWKLAAALEAVRDADALICCGDLCSPFIVHQLGRGFAGPIHVVFGNKMAISTASAPTRGSTSICGFMASCFAGV